MTAGPKFYISQSIMGQVKTIAANDGGDKKSKIDTRKGYNELCNLISGNAKMSRTDKQYLMALKAEYLDLREEGEAEKGKTKVNVNGVELLVSKEVVDFANRVAKTDGGKYKDEVDNGAGYKALIELLNNNTIAMTSADRAYIKILITYYEEKYLGDQYQQPVEPEPEPEPPAPLEPEPPKDKQPNPAPEHPEEPKPPKDKQSNPAPAPKKTRAPKNPVPEKPEPPKQNPPFHGIENPDPLPILPLPYEPQPYTPPRYSGPIIGEPPQKPKTNPIFGGDSGFYRQKPINAGSDPRLNIEI